MMVLKDSNEITQPSYEWLYLYFYFATYSYFTLSKNIQLLHRIFSYQMGIIISSFHDKKREKV